MWRVARGAGWLAGLGLLLCCGCGGSGGGAGGATGGSVRFTYTWPPSGTTRSVPALNSLRVELNGVVQVLVRPATTLTFTHVPAGDHTYHITGYADTAAAGTSLCTLTWPVTVVEGGEATQTVNWDPAAAAALVAQGLGTPPSLTLAAGQSATLTVVATDAQGAVLLLGAGQIGVTSGNLGVASVDAAGVVAALAAGHTLLHATLAGSSVSLDVNLTVTGVNTAPTAVLAPAEPPSGNVNTLFNFVASGSSDVQDATNALQMRCDWNSDGTWDTDWSNSLVATHTFATAGTYTVTVQVRDTGGLTASASRTVTVKPALTLAPSGTVALTLGQSQAFAATVAGTANTLVHWSADGGTVNAAGLYTAPATAGTYHVTATADADATVFATTTLDVQATGSSVTVQ